MPVDRPLLPALMPHLEPGSVLGRYQLLCVVAQGGMGAVWAARLRADHGFERNVAVKTILPQYAQEKRFRDMFLDEARLASRIIHANVVQVLDLAEQDGVLFQAMEWVEGDSLRALTSAMEARDESIPWPIAIRIVLDVAKGLHAAHELHDERGSPLQVVHRDVSPQNTMVGLDGSVRITDFGIAKARDRLSPETSKGNIRGKLRYMAPEQAVGMPLDRRADIWSLAAILYELLSGRPLYDAPNDASLLYELVSTPPTLLFEKPIPPRLLALLRRAVSRSPEARPPTAEAFGNELRRAAKEAGLEASTEDLAAFFRTHLGARCEARRKNIDKSVRASVTLRSSETELDGRIAVEPWHESAGAPSGNAAAPELSRRHDTLSHFVHAIHAGRRRSLIAGSVLLGGVVLATAWFLFAPRERPVADRYLDLQPASLLLPPTAVASGSSAVSEPVVAPAAPPVSTASALSTNPPARRPPQPGKQLPFEDIDDGF